MFLLLTIDGFCLERETDFFAVAVLQTGGSADDWQSN